MKLRDRVYDEPGVLGTVIATSADGADVFEGETVDVRWDATGETETRLVETLDRVEPSDDLVIAKDERDSIQRQIDAIDAEIRPLEKRRGVLCGELRAAEELIAELAVTDIEIRDSRRTDTGHNRFRALVKSLHPAFYDTNEWTPNGDFDATYADMLPIPHLTLKYGDDADYTESLADALVQYADRFLPDLPEEHRSAVPASLLDYACGESRSWQIQYDPATREAILVNRYRYRYTGTPERSGTLVEMINYARKIAWFSGGPDSGRYDD